MAGSLREDGTPVCARASSTGGSPCGALVVHTSSFHTSSFTACAPRVLRRPTVDRSMLLGASRFARRRSLSARGRGRASVR